MNLFVLLAAIVALFAVIGHFAMGGKMFLKPIMDSNAEAIPKYVMRGLFHYMSAFMVISTFILFDSAFGWAVLVKSTEMILYTGIIYGALALVQILVASTSGIKGGLFKMFQWVFWLLISVLSLLGI